MAYPFGNYWVENTETKCGSTEIRFQIKTIDMIREKVLARVEQGFTWLKMLRVFPTLGRCAGNAESP